MKVHPIYKSLFGISHFRYEVCLGMKFLYSLGLLSFLIGGCSNNLIVENEIIHIGVVGSFEEFQYDNVVYESILVDDLLKQDDLNDNYAAIVIGDRYFDTVTKIEYIDRFETIQMPIIFVDSTKGYSPFIRPSKTAKTKPIYSEYNDDPNKMTVMLTYPQPAITAGKMISYPYDEGFSQLDFESIMEGILIRDEEV